MYTNKINNSLNKLLDILLHTRHIVFDYLKISYTFCILDFNSQEAGKVYKYYTIISNNENICYKDTADSEQQIVLLTLKDEHEATNGGIGGEDQMEAIDTVKCNQNVKIIKLDECKILLTTDEDENFETIEPHLITTTDVEINENTDIKTGKLIIFHR